SRYQAAAHGGLEPAEETDAHARVVSHCLDLTAAADSFARRYLPPAPTPPAPPRRYPQPPPTPLGGAAKAAVSARKGVPPRPGWAGSFTGTPTAEGENTHETGQPNPPRRAGGRSRHGRRGGGYSVRPARRQSRRCRHPALTVTVSV